MFKGYPVIDMHAHIIRENWGDDIFCHTSLAKKYNIDAVVFMANSTPRLDSLEKIQELAVLLEGQAQCKAVFVSAITKELEGKELVDVEKIRPYVIGFSDDGKCLEDLGLLQAILEMNVLVLLHSEPEIDFVLKYCDLRAKIKSGRLHIQHVSKEESVAIIRWAKRAGVDVTCETCLHYAYFAETELATPVNPPLATVEDVEAVREGLRDGTIDCLVTDYAPLPQPRKTGIAGFRSFIPLAYGLVLQGVLTEAQLMEKIYLNPQRIIQSGGTKINLSLK